MKTLIRNATVVLPDAVERLNILLDGSRIASVGSPDSANADEVIDAHGLHLIPGVIIGCASASAEDINFVYA